MLIDATQREAALDHTQSIIVQAPAGSGKTGLLVRRILCLLTIVEKPEEILAITFTRKATAEMRERVISVLNKAKNDAPFDAHEHDMRPLAKDVLARDSEKNWQLLTQPNRLKIQTIDALCAELVRKMPWSSQFGGVPQLETDVEALYKQAAQNLVKKIDQEKFQPILTTLLIHNHGNLIGLQDTLASMLRQRAHWLDLIFNQDALASRAQIERHWQNLQHDTLTQLEVYFGNDLCANLLELARYAGDNLEHISDAQHAVLLVDDALANTPERLIQWQAMVKIVTTKSGIRSPKSINKTIGFPINDDAKASLQAIVCELAEDNKVYSLLGSINALPNPIISDVEWGKLYALSKVLPALVQELYVLMAEQNCADYDELSQRAIDALGNADAPTDLALIQDYTLSHILMDEFQDTSSKQLELLERLTAGWQLEDGRTLFLVGDPMQSIYGFRGGDVKVFLQVREHGINDIKLMPVSLEVNFRSSPVIIDWVNKTMPCVFPAEDSPDLAKVKYTPSVAHQTIDGKVSLHLCVASNSGLETQQTVKLINAISTQHPNEEITVLARKRAPLASIAYQLREAKINFESVELETLADQAIVQDLISLTAIFLHSTDSLAWLSVLRAPWCGINLKDLTGIRQTNAPIIKLLESDDLIPDLSGSGAHKIKQLSHALLPLFAEGERLSLSERVHRAWLRLRAAACYSEHALIHAAYYITQLQTLELAPKPISRVLLIQACEKHKTSSPSSKIKLMTFHKAKGLEFDHTILVGLASKSGGDNRTQALFGDANINDNLLVAPSAGADAPQPSKISFIKQYQKNIADQESARLLYVAATRAKKQLYLFATLKRNKKSPLKPQKGSLLNLLWPELANDFENSPNFIEQPPLAPLQNADQIQRPSITLQSLPQALAEIELPANINITAETMVSQTEQPDFDWAQEQARIIGLAAHQIFQYSDLDNVKNWQNNTSLALAHASLKRSGLSQPHLDKAAKRLSALLQNMAKDPTAHWLFNPTHQDLQQEWALSCAQEGKVANYVIDHSFIDQHNTRWIVDFKTSAHEGANIGQFLTQEKQRYTAQLKKYASLVQALEPERQIKMGLYFPALSEWLEIV